MNRWDGWVRHLDLSTDHPLDSVSATSDCFGEYVLLVHPQWASRADEYREIVEKKLSEYYNSGRRIVY